MTSRQAARVAASAILESEKMASQQAVTVAASAILKNEEDDVTASSESGGVGHFEKVEKTKTTLKW